MTTVSLAEAQVRLAELVEKAAAGEEVIITRDDKPVARLSAERPAERPTRKLGTLKGTVVYMAPDFDEPLEDFKEYMAR
jgi:prevent-host-death family protein